MGKGIVKLGQGQWAVKDGNLLAAKETNGRFKNAEFTVTRGTDATYVGRDGLIVNETGDNTPRIDFTDNTDGHLLLEPQSTNLITYSEDFDETTSDWTNTNVSVETNSTISPQGINNAAKITEDTSNDEHRIQLVFSQTINTNYSYSVFVKANGRDYFGMNIGASRLYANFDLTDGSVTHVQSNGTDFNNESASITSFGNGWYKCTLSGYALTTNGSYVRFTLRNVESVNSTLNYLGDGASGVYIWGAQLEALSHPTSYIPTNGSTVTRDGETCLNAGEAADFNSEEGTFYVDVSALGDTNANQISISLSNTDSSDRILIYANSGGGKWLVQYRKNTSSFVTIEKPIAISNQSKIAVVWKSGRYVMYLNGQKATNYTAGSETESTAFDQNDMKTLQFIPNKGSTGNYFYGKVNAIKVYKEALSDSELTTLTS